MSVPFTQLGTGQVGRLVYQVIGKDGPVFNPQNIRFLPPNTTVDGSATLLSNTFSMSTGLAAANLLTSAGTLAISAFALSKIKQCEENLKSIMFDLSKIDQKIDRLVAAVERIDINVAENNLRHALQHLIKISISTDGIDLVGLARIMSDLDKFLESLEGYCFGSYPSLRFSSDVHDLLEKIWTLFFSIRLLVANINNKKHAANPFRAFSVNYRQDYCLDSFSPPEIAFNFFLLENSPLIAEEIGEFVKDRFTFAGIVDKQAVKGFAEEIIFDYIQNNINPATLAVLSNILDTINEKDEFMEIHNKAMQYRDVWLFRSDSGIIWRTMREVRMFLDGYPNWKRDAVDTVTSNVEYTCDLTIKG